MRVLISGGAGFIGSHLVEEMLSEGHDVRVLDNLSTGRRENVPNHRRVELVVGDIRDLRLVERVTDGVEAIVHLAAVASVQASVDDPVGTHASNLEGTIHLLEAARRTGVRRFLYASSAAVYGNDAAIPVREDAAAHPVTPYAVDKLAGEHYLQFYGKRYGIAATAFRFFNIYGPRQDPSSPYSGVISIFAKCVKEREPVTLYGDGRQTRDFVYVGDLARLLAHALRMRSLAGRVLNVGRGREASLLDLIAALERVSGHSIERRHAEARHGDIRHSCADIARLREFMRDDVPETDLDAGLGALLHAAPVRQTASAGAPERPAL